MKVMIIRFFYEGGPSFMAPIYLMWIIVFTQIIRFVILYRGNKNPQKLKRTNDSILFFGSLAFLIGIYGQITGLITAFDSVQCISDVSIIPRALAGGFKVTFIVTVFGLMLLMLSAIFWFAFRNLKKYPGQQAAITK